MNCYIKSFSKFNTHKTAYVKIKVSQEMQIDLRRHIRHGTLSPLEKK